MEANPIIKKKSIQLRVLLNDVIDYNWGSFFGVQSMDPDVLRLWLEYNKIRSVLIEYGQISESHFPELEYPEPYLADTDSFFSEGTMIYKPEHFTPLRMTIEDLLKEVNITRHKESA